ncbi:hypothetical protein [Paenibacillus sediminis]|nr:hypothetical protein [Paenibacillus sediminis]
MFPTTQAAERQDDLSQMVVYNSLTQFVDAVRTKGYLTPIMYEDFITEMNATGGTYQVEMEHLHKKYHPEYSDPANPNTFEDKFSVYYDGFYTEKLMNVLFPDNNEPKDSDDRKYKFNVGDFFTVTVKNTNRTISSVLRDFLTGSNRGDGTTIAVPYGGMILNEDY